MHRATPRRGGITVNTLRTIMALALALAVSCYTLPTAADAQSGGYRISGPAAHGNLSVFLIHGADEVGQENVLTLQEAMAQGILVVHETSSVNELAVENTSSDRDVFIQSGDIVKGGKQDRVL